MLMLMGPTGQAFDFDGSSRIGLGANFNFAGDASFSVSFWIDSEQKASEEFIVSHLGYDINKRAWKISKFNQFLVFDTYSNGVANPRITFNTDISLNRAGTSRFLLMVFTHVYTLMVFLANGGVALPRYDTQGSVITKNRCGRQFAVCKCVDANNSNDDV